MNTMSRLPVLPPAENPVYENFEIYWRDEEDGKEREVETLTLVTEKEAQRCASAWQKSSWVLGRRYGYRKVEK